MTLFARSHFPLPRVDQVRPDGVGADVVGVVGAVLEDLVDDAVDEGGVGSRADGHELVRLGTGDREARVDRDEPGAVLVPGVAHDPPVRDRGLGDVVGPEDDRLGAHEVDRLVTGEEPAGVGGVRRVDKDVVPTCRSGRVTLVVTLGVARRSADDAREAEPGPDDALDAGRASRCRGRPRPPSCRTSPGSRWKLVGDQVTSPRPR